MTPQQAEHLRQAQAAMGIGNRRPSPVEQAQETRWQATQQGTIVPSDLAPLDRVVGERDEWVEGWAS